jgi:hypothetical protein
MIHAAPIATAIKYALIRTVILPKNNYGPLVECGKKVAKSGYDEIDIQIINYLRELLQIPLKLEDLT